MKITKPIPRNASLAEVVRELLKLNELVDSPNAEVRFTVTPTGKLKSITVGEPD